jgi:hypothetical protein
MGNAVSDGLAGGVSSPSCPQHFLYFFSLPQGHGSFLPGFTNLAAPLLAGFIQRMMPAGSTVQEIQSASAML